MLWGLHPLWGPGWGPGPGLHGFRSEPATATQVMESLGGAESDRGGLPGEGVQDPQKTSQDLDLALGLRSAGHCVCLLLFAEGVVCEQKVFRKSHRSNYTWASDQYCSTDGSSG